MRAALLALLLLTTSGCGLFRSTPGPPPPRIDVLASAPPALRTLNAQLPSGERYRLTTSGGDVGNVRYLAIGRDTTFYRQQNEIRGVYLPTSDVLRVVRVDESAAEAGAAVGALTSLVAAFSVILLTTSEDETGPAGFVGVGLTAGAAGLGALVGRRIGVARAQVVYEGPVDRYLAPPTPAPNR